MNISNSQDPRPIKDVSWRKKFTSHIVEYVTKLPGWPAEKTLDPKALLNCPANHDFRLVLTTLLKKLNITIDVLDGEELTSIKKALKYPYNIPIWGKTVQISPLTWPALFGFLVWLVDYFEKVEPHRIKQSEGGLQHTNNPTGFMAWVSPMYEQNLNGDGDWKCEVLQVKQRIDAKYEEVSQHLKEKQYEMAQINQRLQKIDEDFSKQVNVSQVNENLKRDFRNFGNYLVALEEHITAIQKKLDEDSKISAELVRECEKISQEKATIERVIQNQPLTQEQEQKLSQRKTICNARLADIATTKPLEWERTMVEFQETGKCLEETVKKLQQLVPSLTKLEADFAEKTLSHQREIEGIDSEIESGMSCLIEIQERVNSRFQKFQAETTELLRSSKFFRN
jgi:SMC interacting uncharacterized protein involved in chromosome segregation